MFSSLVLAQMLLLLTGLCHMRPSFGGPSVVLIVANTCTQRVEIFLHAPHFQAYAEEHMRCFGFAETD